MSLFASFSVSDYKSLVLEHKHDGVKMSKITVSLLCQAKLHSPSSFNWSDSFTPLLQGTSALSPLHAFIILLCEETELQWALSVWKNVQCTDGSKLVGKTPVSETQLHADALLQGSALGEDKISCWQIWYNWKSSDTAYQKSFWWVEKQSCLCKACSWNPKHGKQIVYPQHDYSKLQVLK